MDGKAGGGGNGSNGLSVKSEIVPGSRRVQLPPGHSLMGWIKLSKTEDLAGTGGQELRVTHEELGRHNTAKDAWIAIRGDVFNVTRYLAFHPGGKDELMTGVGTDATALFDETHNWVNYKSLLASCRIGPLVRSSEITE